MNIVYTHIQAFDHIHIYLYRLCNIHINTDLHKILNRVTDTYFRFNNVSLLQHIILHGNVNRGIFFVMGAC